MMGGNNDILGINTQQWIYDPLPINISTSDTYGLGMQPTGNQQMPSIAFDALTGWLNIAGDASNNVVKQTLTNNGYYQLDIDGHLFSSDRSSSSFWQSLDGAIGDNVVGINFDGGLGNDTLILGSQAHQQNFQVIADDSLGIQGEVHSESVFFKAKDIVNQGKVVAHNITAEFSHSYSDEATSKMSASNGGSILLNGEGTGRIEAKGDYEAIGNSGGQIEFRGKTVDLIGAKLDASGDLGGGTILIGGDYQGGHSNSNRANAESTSVDANTQLLANAKDLGNGGKVIIWSDRDTDFQGDVQANGGRKGGDGGFVEVSGKKSLNFVGNVDVDAAKGKIGSVLLDPEDIIINTENVAYYNKLKGNVTLVADNDIYLFTNTSFVPSSGTLTLSAGGTVNLFGNISAPQHNVKITAGAIVGYGSISSSNGTGKAGYVWLESQREIDLNVGSSTIFTESGGSSGNIGGNITLKAGTTINAGFLTAAGTIRGGNINISAIGDIVASTLRSFSIENTGGKIDVVSTSGGININAYVSSYGLGGKGGAITMSAYGDIISNDIHADSSQIGNGAKVELTSQTGRIDTNGYQISATNTGNAGSVILKAYQDIVVGDIAAYSVSSGNGGKVELTSQTGRIDTSGKQIATSASNGNAGKVILNAYLDIAVGDGVSAYSGGGGNGGKVEITSQQQGIKVGNIFTKSWSGDGVWNGGKVTLKAKLGSIDGTVESGDIITTSVNGNAGAVTIEAGGDIEAGSITTTSITGNAGNVTIKAISRIKVGNVDTFASNNGDAGDVSLLADDDIETLAINANVKGDGAGKGIGGTVKLVSKMGDILTDYVRTDSAGSIGGNITLDAGAALLSAAGIGGTVRAINSFSIAGQDFSLYAGIRSGAAIEVKYRDQSFAFGDATENGTKGMVMSGASLATDARFETLNLAPQSGYKTQLRLVSYASDPEKLKINSLIDKSYNDQYSSILVKTAQAIYSSQSIYFYLSSLLTNPSGALLGAIVAGFQAYLSEVQLLQKAKLLTGVAAFKDTKYFSNEAYSPDGTPLGNFVATNAESVAKYALPNIERLLVSARKFDVTDNAQIAYIMATASHETWFGIQDFYGSIKDHPALYEKGNGTFRSKDEYNYFQEAYGTYQFRGRGYVQLTGMEQYQTMQNKFGNQYGVNLLSVTNKNGSDNPWKWTYGADVVATNRNLAADITVYGMQKDLFRAPNPSSMPFNGYLNNTNDSNAKDNFTQARKIVNSYIDENGGIINKELDIAKNIASNAINYYDALNGKLIQNTSKV